jgi:hypothetical protein
MKRSVGRKRRSKRRLRKGQLRRGMDKKIKEDFVDEYVTLCKKYGIYLWSGEPWYGLDLIVGDIDEKKIRDWIAIYDD